MRAEVLHLEVVMVSAAIWQFWDYMDDFVPMGLIESVMMGLYIILLSMIPLLFDYFILVK